MSNVKQEFQFVFFAGYTANLISMLKKELDTEVKIWIQHSQI
jgi:hypothetical protein